MVVLRCLREACADGQLLVDLFVNFDCDLDSSNLFERLINGLVKIAQQPLPPPGDYTATQQVGAWAVYAISLIAKRHMVSACEGAWLQMFSPLSEVDQKVLCGALVVTAVSLYHPAGDVGCCCSMLLPRMQHL